MSKYVLISLKDLRNFVEQRETAARIDEIKRAKVHGYTRHLKRRMALLTGEESVRVLSKKNPLLRKGASLKLSNLTDFSDIVQYIGRR